MSTGRVPPHDLDAETAVISALLLNPDCIDGVREICDESAFYSDANRHIFRVILKLHSEGESIDQTRVRSRLKSDGRLQQIGGAAYLVDITRATPAIINVEAHARTIQDLGRVRRAIQIHHRFAANGFGNLDDPKAGYDDRERVQRYLSEALEQLSDIAYERQHAYLKPLNEVLVEVQQDISLATKAPDSITGIPTGFSKMDRLTAGLHGGDVNIIASRPGMGKTALMLSMARKTSKLGWAVPLFSLEMPAKQLGLRLLAQETNIDLSLLRSGRFTNHKWQDITEALNRLKVLPIFIDDSPGITILDVRGRTRVLQREIAAGKYSNAPRGIGFVGIDYLQLMGSLAWRKSREEQISQTSQMCKRVAKELNLPFVPLSQLNRQPDQRKSVGGRDDATAVRGRPELSDLRESGAIEQDADNVIFVYRPAYYDRQNPSIEFMRRAELIIAKQRNGPTATVNAVFFEETARFENLADEEAPDEYAPDETGSEASYGLPDSLD